MELKKDRNKADMKNARRLPEIGKNTQQMSGSLAFFHHCLASVLYSPPSILKATLNQALVSRPPPALCKLARPFCVLSLCVRYGVDHMKLACRRTTVALKAAPREHSLARVLSPVALRERSLTNVNSFTRRPSRTFYREHSLANVLSRKFPRKPSLHSRTLRTFPH